MWRLLQLVLLLATAVATYIVPGGRILDTDGDVVNAHAGCIIYDDNSSLYYLFGEYKTQAVPEGGGVSVYSSPDLSHWTSHGLALKDIPGNPLLSPGARLQRPKVVKAEGKYQMWFANDNSTNAFHYQGHATSDNITGPYTYIESVHPLGEYYSSDYGLFTDYKTNITYTIFAGGLNGSTSNDVIARYNENATAVEEIIYVFSGFNKEGPTIVQTDESYYALMSFKTGYRPNNVLAFRADNLTGPWSQPNLIAARDTRTYNSQSGNNLRIKGSKQTTHLYLGDRWENNMIWDSRFMWVPINIDENKHHLSIDFYDVFHLDVTTGEWWQVAGTPYFAVDAETTGNATKVEASFADNTTIVTGINGSASTVTFTNVKGCGAYQWVSFYYQNADDLDYSDGPGCSGSGPKGACVLERISGVMVNNNATSNDTLVQLDTWVGVIQSTPLQMWLPDGNNNITISGLYNGYGYSGADIEKIVVYPPE